MTTIINNIAATTPIAISAIIASLANVPMTLESGLAFGFGSWTRAESTRFLMENSPFFITMTSNGGIELTSAAGDWLARTSPIIEAKSFDNGYCYLVTENGHKYNLATAPSTAPSTVSPTINELINAIFEETKRQKDKRAEYLSLVFNLIDNTEREGEFCYHKINFRYYEDMIGRKRVSFSQTISMRKERGLTSYDIECANEENKAIDRCINTLCDFGEGVVDKFIEHLVKVAIPQFLQGRSPRDYDVY